MSGATSDGPDADDPTPVWINGALLAPDLATVAFDDHGLTVGDGVFETIKVTCGRPFALDAHFDRLHRSAATMAIPCPDRAELREAVDAVCGSNSPTGFLRVTLTAGPGPLGTPRGDLSPTLIVAVRSGGVRHDPTDVIVVPWTRNERSALAGVKSTSYGENVVALATAAQRGASEALFANTRDELCEGTGSNVFVGLGGRLLTPPVESGCLAGVTRALLLALGVGEEETIPMAALDGATEMFLVSTAREVQPVQRIDGRNLPACPGPMTIAARAAWVAAHGE